MDVCSKKHENLMTLFHLLRLRIFAVTFFCPIPYNISFRFHQRYSVLHMSTLSPSYCLSLMRLGARGQGRGPLCVSFLALLCTGTCRPNKYIHYGYSTCSTVIKIALDVRKSPHVPYQY